MSATLSIQALFEVLADLEALQNLQKALGVYINLVGDPSHPARVGEGLLCTRARASWRPRKSQWMIACVLGSRCGAKRDAEIVEWLIIAETERRTGRRPRRNLIRGKSSVVRRSLARRDWICVTFTGHSPFHGRPISNVLKAVIWLDDDNELAWRWEEAGTVEHAAGGFLAFCELTRPKSAEVASPLATPALDFTYANASHWSSAVCPRCGNYPGDRFCADCGVAI